MIEKKHMKGNKKGDVLLYALSTCIWCRRTRKLLDELGIDYQVIEVDLIEDEKDKNSVRKQISKWNPEVSFPTMVINDNECILGFDEDKIKARLG